MTQTIDGHHEKWDRPRVDVDASLYVVGFRSRRYPAPDPPGPPVQCISQRGATDEAVLPGTSHVSSPQWDHRVERPDEVESGNGASRSRIGDPTVARHRCDRFNSGGLLTCQSKRHRCAIGKAGNIDSTMVGTCTNQSISEYSREKLHIVDGGPFRRERHCSIIPALGIGQELRRSVGLRSK